jgi:hypothetical protein
VPPKPNLQAPGHRRYRGLGYEMASLKNKTGPQLAAGRRRLTSSSVHHGLAEAYHSELLVPDFTDDRLHLVAKSN